MFSAWEFVYNLEKWCLELYNWQNDKEKYQTKNWEILIRKWEIWEDLYFGIKAKELWYTMYANKYAVCKHYRNLNDFISINDIECRNQNCQS